MEEIPIIHAIPMSDSLQEALHTAGATATGAIVVFAIFIAAVAIRGMFEAAPPRYEEVSSSTTSHETAAKVLPHHQTHLSTRPAGRSRKLLLLPRLFRAICRYVLYAAFFLALSHSSSSTVKCHWDWLDLG